MPSVLAINIFFCNDFIFIVTKTPIISIKYVRLSFLHVSTRLPLDGFTRNLI